MNASIPSEPSTHRDGKTVKHARVQQRSRPTHFLTLPLSSPLCKKASSTAAREHLRSSLDKFAHTVSPDIVPPEAFRPPGVIHFTCGVMTLRTAREIEDAVAALEGLEVDALLRDATTETGPGTGAAESQVSSSAKSERGGDGEDAAGFMIDLVGLQPLPPLRTGVERGKARVLFATARPAEPVTAFAQDVWRAFEHARTKVAGEGADGHVAERERTQMAREEKEAMVKGGERERDFLLHATLVNTIYVRSQHHKPRNGARAGNGTSRGGRSGRKFMIPIRTAPINLASAAGVDAAAAAANGDGGDETACLDLSVWRNHVWAAGVRIDRIALCKMGASRVDGEWVYEELASLALA